MDGSTIAQATDGGSRTLTRNADLTPSERVINQQFWYKKIADAKQWLDCVIYLCHKP